MKQHIEQIQEMYFILFIVISAGEIKSIIQQFRIFEIKKSEKLKNFYPTS